MADDFDYARYDRIRPLRWTGTTLGVLDQRKLPFTTEYLSCQTSDEVASAIHARMRRIWAEPSTTSGGEGLLGAVEAFAMIVPYAAATAACYAKELLGEVDVVGVEQLGSASE